VITAQKLVITACPVPYRSEAHGVLHPRVRRENEHGGEHGAHTGEPDRSEVHALAYATTTEDPDAEERRLHKEGQQTFDGQGRPKDVTDEHRVTGPVHAKLELLDKSR